MSRARSERWLRKLWAGTDLVLAPYERPPPVAPAVPSMPPHPAARAAAAAAGPSRDAQMEARIEQILSIRPDRGAAATAAATAAAAKKRPLPIDRQGASHTQGVAAVEHLAPLYRLGRNDHSKRQKKPGSFNTAQLDLQAACTDPRVRNRELNAIRRSQAFSDPRNRPGIIAQSVAQWRQER